MTFPARVEDGPAGLGVEGERYPGVEGRVVYGEGVLVGYRFYETTRLAPRFPFGFGLSYGDVAFEEVRVDGDLVTVTLVNNGHPAGHRGRPGLRAGAGVLVRRPDRELVGFAKVVAGSRRPGDGPGASSAPPPSATGTWTRTAWRADPGRYEVLVGSVVARHPGKCRGRLHAEPEA